MKRALFPPGVPRDLRGDIGEARRLLAQGFDRIVLRRDEDGRLWAEVRENLAGLLNLEGADQLIELVPEERHPRQSVWSVVRVRVA